MPYFSPFTYFKRRAQPTEDEATEGAIDEPLQVPDNEEEGRSDFDRFRSLLENNPDFLVRVFDDPAANPTPGRSIPNEETPELPILEEAQDNNTLSESARRLRKRRLEQRIANRENMLRAREQYTEPTPNIRSNPIALSHDDVNITFQRISHRQERKFGLLVINYILPYLFFLSFELYSALVQIYM